MSLSQILWTFDASLQYNCFLKFSILCWIASLNILRNSIFIFLSSFLFKNFYKRIFLAKHVFLSVFYLFRLFFLSLYLFLRNWQLDGSYYLFFSSFFTAQVLYSFNYLKVINSAKVMHLLKNQLETRTVYGKVEVFKSLILNTNSSLFFFRMSLRKVGQQTLVEKSKKKEKNKT